ncbi:MAG: aminotransferase class I/II-fold pyridoxal phosphate-dependent enzyme [Prevotella sp.]|nr:aminotransferase class I/II-fold pyridoxal phosphate-dependent enzyme [Bacteroides sp.]MCM1366591.1 aminotransferase class I/II-fold pyridoxal phosphate-dependent enzyme [Prevotella sp.]MCM1437312.1 aminotransferase class I/II-fold pyridoxal phosphate-dependent enzyme [Prevotella sp.]
MTQLGFDYSHGAHPKVLNRIIELNMCAMAGYGQDSITKDVSRQILEKCGLDAGTVFFLSGGTQTNAVAIDILTAKGEGVICAPQSHINVHEAAAIEAVGNKVITLPDIDFKITADVIERYMQGFYNDLTWPHMVIPGMVYITQPTELGTLYSLQELTAIKEVCEHYNLKLYLDGARLAYALGCNQCDTSLKNIAEMCDAFYIGGTKCGALFGEALVIKNMDGRQGEQYLFNTIKRHGALFAKGWLIAAQFDMLLRDGLYEELGANAVKYAIQIKNFLTAKGIECFIPSQTNQQFFKFSNKLLERLDGKVGYGIWGAPGKEITDVRLVTDWSTTNEEIEKLMKIIDKR